MTDTKVMCGKCLIHIENENGSEDQQKRMPCPNCGSVSRHISKHLFDTITLKEMVGAKAKRKGERKPYIEQLLGDDFSTKLNKWMKKLRIIDRDNDIYKEKVFDPETNYVIHYCEESLKQHVGHGSAKKCITDETKDS